MPTAKPSLTPAVFYRDPRAALGFLEAAFGFELSFLLEDAEGNLAHSQMSYGDGLIMVGAEWSDLHQSPASLDGRMTQTVHIAVETDIDAHCERARAAGMTIVAEPQTQFYGERTYRARDPEGHVWTVSQVVEAVSIDEMEQRTGMTFAVGR